MNVVAVASVIYANKSAVHVFRVITEMLQAAFPVVPLAGVWVGVWGWRRRWGWELVACHLAADVAVHVALRVVVAAAVAALLGLTPPMIADTDAMDTQAMTVQRRWPSCSSNKHLQVSRATIAELDFAIGSRVCILQNISWINAS